MKKNNEILNVNENENVVVMDQETMQAVIEDNMQLVPKNQLKNFKELSLDEQFKKIQYYQDRAVKIEMWKKSASVPNKVRELFEKRGTIEDAKAVLQFCTEFIDGFKQREIEKIDEEIARLEEMKRSL